MIKPNAQVRVGVRTSPLVKLKRVFSHFGISILPGNDVEVKNISCFQEDVQLHILRETGIRNVKISENPIRSILCEHKMGSKM